jgi:hypothetical protein
MNLFLFWKIVSFLVTRKQLHGRNENERDVPLPFFSFVLCYFVIAGLDPANHVAAKLVKTFRSAFVAALQDVPPGQARW